MPFMYTVRLPHAQRHDTKLRHLTPIIIVSIICIFKIIYRYLTVRWLAIGTNVCNVHKGPFISTEILFGFFFKAI